MSVQTSGGDFRTYKPLSLSPMTALSARKCLLQHLETTLFDEMIVVWIKFITFFIIT
jgi:hypothetical protein